MRHIYLVLTLCAIACGACSGGHYAQGGSAREGDVDRGETNGRMFDFVSNKPEGDDWQVRIRGSSLWASYGNGDEVDDLGTRNLSDKETRKVWKLIDALELPERESGKRDEDEGYVQLRLREPGGDEGHEIISVNVSRADADDAVLDLAEYLRTLIASHYSEKPNF